jgi:hypothetical protein
MRIRMAVLAAVFSCMAAVAQDEKPNFTGVWKRSSRDSSATCKIEQQDPALTFICKSQWTAGSSIAGMSGAETYTAGTFERESNPDTGGERWVSVDWQGRSFVILRVVKNSYCVSVTREIWTLSEDGQTLTKNRRTIDMDGVAESSEVLRKQ